MTPTATMLLTTLAVTQPQVLPPEAYLGSGPSSQASQGWREPTRAPARPDDVVEAPATRQAQPTRRDEDEGPKVLLREVRFRGNTLIEDEELDKIAAPFLGRLVSLAELEDLRDKVTWFYVHMGYLNSGAVLPDQDASDGVVELTIIQGTIDEVEVVGTRRLDPSYLRRRLGRYRLTRQPKVALRFEDVEDQLLLLNRDPLLDAVQGRILPGDAPGRAKLQLGIKEADPFTVELEHSNHASPAIGDSLRLVRAHHGNLTGRGDTLAAAFGETEGANFYSLAYRWFLGGDPRHTLTVSAGQTASALRTQTARALDIENETDTVGVTYRRTLSQNRTLERGAGVGFLVEENRSTLGGTPFNLLGDGTNGKTKATVLQLFHDWTKRAPDYGWNWRTGVDVGLDLGFGSITKGAEPDAQFWAWRNSFAYLRQLKGSREKLFFRFTSQVTGDRLIPQERFLIGGYRTVRGYRENQLNTDSGVVASLEWRMPLGKTWKNHSVELVPFLDYGRGWNEGADPSVDELASAGVGVRVQEGRFLFDVFWAENFQGVTVPAGGRSLQDDGVHFSVKYRLF